MTDVLGDDRPGRPAGPVRRWAVPAVLLALVAGGAGERAVRAHEAAQVRACVRQADRDVADAAARAAAVEAYAGPLLYGATTPPRVRESLVSLVQQSVAARLPALRADRSRCSAGWQLHPSARRARRDYLAWLDLRLGQLTTASTDLDALHHDVPGVEGARRRAERSLRALGVRA